MISRQSKVRLTRHPAAHLALSVFLCSPFALFAQSPAGSSSGRTSLPDTPKPKSSGPSNPAVEKTSRFIGYVSNRSIVFPDLANSAGPLSPGGKFRLFVNQSISPPYILAATIRAAYGQARDVPPAYGQGWDAFGNRYGAAIARSSSNSFFGTFLFASILREDPRFFPQSAPTIWGSAKYSAKRLFVTRTDSGGERFNTSGILGTLASEAMANTYLPGSEQTGAKNAERFATDLAWRFAGNMFKNYWPTLFRNMGLNRLKVIPDPGSTDNSPAPRQQ